MNWFEAGILRGALEKNHTFDELPKSLKLKLNILFSQAYLSHPTLGKQAKKDINNYIKELKSLERREEHEKSK
jgi:hypothetical protein